VAADTSDMQATGTVCLRIATAIATTVQVIDLGDDMEFTLLPAGSSSDVLVCSDPTIPHDDSNLVIKVGGRATIAGVLIW
jgi:hypothetical protein